MALGPLLHREDKQTWKVYTRILGIEVVESELEIAHGVSLLQIGPDKQGDFIDDLLTRQDATYEHFGFDPITKQTRDQYVASHKSFFDAPLACAVVTATLSDATTLAGEKIRSALVALNLLAIHSYGREHRIRIAIAGELFSSSMVPEFLLHSQDTPDTSRIAKYYIKPSQLLITNEFIDQFDSGPVQHLSSLLLRSSIRTATKPGNEMGDRLSIALEWFARGINTKGISVQALSYFTILELLLKSSTDSSISAEISEGCALLLESELEKRQTMRSSVKELYDKRSKLVHHGLELFTDSDVIELESIAVRTILFMAENMEWIRTRALLDEEIVRRKLS